MNSYADVLSSEGLMVMMGLTFAVVTILAGKATRWGYKISQYRVPQEHRIPFSPAMPEWLVAGMFVLMGFIPYGTKVRFLSDVPKNVAVGEIVEVDRVGGETLLRIKTKEGGIIKVVRPSFSSWPTSPGPVEVEKFTHGQHEVVYRVSSPPKVEE